MRRILISLTVIALLLVPQFTSAGDVDDLKAEFKKAIQAWNSLDAEPLVKMRHSGFVNFDYDAAFPEVRSMKSNQAQEIEVMKSLMASLDFISINIYNPQFRVAGKTGIIWGHYTINIKPKGEPVITRHARMTSTWVKSDGKWKILMAHGSAIPSVN